MANWLNYNVFGYGKWPREEKEVEIDQKLFTLCPLTKEKQASIHIDLTAQRILMDDAIALISRFLSHLSWFSHQPYWLGFGFSGGAVKNTNFEREQRMLFERMIVDFPDGFELYTDTLHLQALAFYREAQVAKHYSSAHACLSYYKILEIEKRKSGPENLNQWINEQLPKIEKQNDHMLPVLKRFANDKNMCLSKFFFYVRNEAAHYMTDSEISLDDNSARKLFGHATQPLEDLAIRYIENKLGISDNLFSVSYHKNSYYALNKQKIERPTIKDPATK